MSVYKGIAKGVEDIPDSLCRDLKSNCTNSISNCLGRPLPSSRVPSNDLFYLLFNFLRCFN